MIMLIWILPVASGCRAIPCMAPWPIRPRPIPEPMAAMPMPIGSPSARAAWKFMVLLLGWSVSVLRLPLVMLVVRQHEEDVNRGQNREHERLQRAGEQCQRVEDRVERDAHRQMREHADAERREAHHQHVLAEDVAEESA